MSTEYTIQQLKEREQYLKRLNILFQDQNNNKDEMARRSLTDDLLGQMYGLSKQATLGE